MWVATVLVLIATMPGGIRKQLGVDDVQPQSRLGVLLKAKYNRSRITSSDIVDLQGESPGIPMKVLDFYSLFQTLSLLAWTSKHLSHLSA